MRAAATSIILALGVGLSAQQTAPLKIVVVEGEAGVNIIQQKTAVRPVIEVRDRNNLPVSGALVTFSIEGGKAATFGGASTLTVATNAAGQAAVSSLTPNIAGAFQIQVSAAFQGQIATAAIAQTNVLTAAEAAAAAGAAGSGSAGAGAGGGGGGAGAGGAGGAAGGAGGGLSATTIAVAGAAVAGGAVAATQVVGKEEDGKSERHFTGSFSGTTTETVTNRNGSCVITRLVSGDAELDVRGDDVNVSGEFRSHGTQTVTATTCAAVNQSGIFGGTTSVSGPSSAIRGTSTGSNTQPGQSGETITGTFTHTFEGSINGSTATGTYRFESRSTATGGAGGSVDSTFTPVTFSIALTKS